MMMSLLEWTLSGTAFILAIALFRAAALRRLPKGTFVALWWAAALRLLIPLDLPSRFSVYTLLDALRPKAAVPAARMVPTEAVKVPQVLIVPTRPPAAVPPSPEPFPVWTVLWLAGAALLALWFMTRYVRWRRRFRESIPADCPGLETWFQSRRKIQIRVTDRIAAPLTYGLIRPVILLPKTMDLDDEEAVTCVLAHELAHIRRLDGLLKLVLAAALCVHWFNPAVWLFYVLANQDMELRCDEAAVLSLGVDCRERYALALIRLAENECVPLCGFSQRNGMEERIKAIMSIKKKSLLACATALVLALAITTAFATSAKPLEDTADDLPSGEGTLEAQFSEEVAAQWKELLTPYEAFGLTYEFDDPDHDGNGLTMWFEGHEVRGIFDGKSGAWITEHAGNGAYGPDAVELYTMYDETGLTGLRLATEEEQAAFDQDRKLPGDAVTVEALGKSVFYEDGSVYFTIPESDGLWNIWISGRIVTEDGMGMSVHYLEEESEKGEWIPGKTYSFETADAAYDELTLDVKYGNATLCYPLTLILPGGNAPLASVPLPEGKADVPEDGTLVWPVDGGTITNFFGERANPGGTGKTNHSGVDIGGVEKGAPVYAAAAGTVDAAGYESTTGNYVVLLHENQMTTTYSHCDSVLVKTGDKVKAGQTIATIGSTGMSTGPHLHFQVLVNQEERNPLEFFPYWDMAENLTGTQ